MITLFFYIYSGAFETLTPAGGLSNCQDVLCAVAYAADCTSFLYNRLDDSCAIYNRKIETPKCDIRSAVPTDNLADCENPTDQCQVSIRNLLHMYLHLSIYLFFTIFLAFH